MKLLKLSFFILAVLLVFISNAQDRKPASIGGIVKDARTKAPLKEAVITISSDVFKGQKYALTDTTGVYRITNLPPGNYVITFEMEGYKKFTQESIPVKEGMSVAVSYEMVRDQSAPRNLDQKPKSKKDQISL
jgi:Ca-activated chloride channel family protein